MASRRVLLALGAWLFRSFLSAQAAAKRINSCLRWDPGDQQSSGIAFPDFSSLPLAPLRLNLSTGFHPVASTRPHSPSTRHSVPFLATGSLGDCSAVVLGPASCSSSPSKHTAPAPVPQTEEPQSGTSARGDTCPTQ